VLAIALACQLIVVPFSVPAAVPDTLRPPAQLALNDPIADVGDCCVGVHLKSVQLDGAGMTLADVDCQVPTSAATVLSVGLVTVVLLSYDTHAPAAAQSASAQTEI